MKKLLLAALSALILLCLKACKTENNEDMVKDIPIGKYSVKAVYSGKTLLLKRKRVTDVEEINKEVVFAKDGFLADTEYNIEFMVSE
jgi:hypothetical protein